ncbi:MAG: glycosyltransferase [Phycisphaerae bacterium]|nr:glycosyltransferase [Phycisphaerae bacterium]MCZ2400342.1 glycosyltransferase [Phycisphaerae bacterium]
MSQRPIVILTATAGAGHNVAARAICDAFGQLAPGVPVELHDVLEFCPAPFRALYSGGYACLIAHAPRVFGCLYDAVDRPGRGPAEVIRLLIQNGSTGGVRRYLGRTRPRLVINTQFLPAEIVARQRRCGVLDCPQWTVLTDFEAFRLWIQPPTERYYVGSPLAAQYLYAGGVPAGAVHEVGIPIRPAFWSPLDRKAMRLRHALVPDRPVVLVSCGRGGSRPLRLAEALTEVRSDAQIVLVAGRDERLRARLEARWSSEAPRVRVLGHTDLMHEWMHAADVLVSKPGGLTSAEALACRLPMVIVDPIPGQETRNSDYLLEQGVAIKVNALRLLSVRVNQLLSEPRTLAAMREAAGRLARPRAAWQIVSDALALLGHEAPARPDPVAALT